MSPMEAMQTCWMGVCSMTSARVWAKFSRITMAVAPESLSWCSSSRAVYSGFTFTQVKPARSTPAMVTPNCGTLGSMMATRASGARPRLCSHAPRAALWWSSSP